MGIRFPDVVDVHGAYFVAQVADSAWTTGVRVIGYRDGKEVKTTAWFDGIAATPTWFEIDLQGVDRIVIQSTPRIDGAGWYALDDLTYARSAQTGEKGYDVVVLDFEDCGYGQKLTDSDYAGLVWEAGAGDFESDDGVPAPQAISYDEDDNVSSEPQRDSGLRGLGTLPTLDLSFQGTIRGDPGTTIPPDTCGAVGPNHFVETINRNFSVFLKTTGQRVMNTTLGSFLPGSNGDPRVLFDQHSNRWIVTVPDFNTRIYLAVSLTDDPTGSWFKTNFTVSQGTDSNCWPDYPTLGVDSEGIYAASYMVGCGMSIFAIDKAPLIAASPSLGTVTAWRGLVLDGAVQPVHTFGDPGGEYFVSRASSTSLRIRRVNGPLTSPSLTTLNNVTIPTHSFPPDAPALGSSEALDTVGHRLMNAVYRNGSIWTAHAIGVSGRAACRWYEVGISPLQLLQSGTVSDASLYYFFPTIMVNFRGDAIMAFSGSDANQYAAAYYTGRRVEDPAGEMADPALLRAGAGSQNNLDGFGRNRWGDYSLCSLDPDDDLTMWTIQEYAHATNIWGTQIARLSFGDCNGNDIDDPQDIAAGTSLDCNINGIPDECEEDCNGNGVPDDCDIAGGTSEDCDGNGIPDSCDITTGASPDCNFNSIPDGCEIAEWIVADPEDTNVCPGDTAIFAIATLSPGLGLQWKKDGEPLSDGGDVSGVTTDTLTIVNVETADAGAYTCDVTEGCLAGETAPGNLAVPTEAAAITIQPDPQVLKCSDNTVQLTVEASGLFVTYEWRKDGMALTDGGRISGTTTPTLQITNVTEADSGSYTCFVLNPCGGEESAPSVFGIATPAFTLQPADECGESGQMVQFAVDATSAISVGYFWEKDGETVLDDPGHISGAFTNTLTIESVMAGDDGQYNAVAFSTPNPVCFADSQMVTLTVGGCGGCVSTAVCPEADVNCDNVVNALDIAAVSSSANFGLAAGSADEPRADVNADGVVNALDITSISSSACFGQ